MKKLVMVITLSALWAQIFCQVLFNNSELPYSINESGNAPKSSAILDIQSESKGILIPRMTTNSRVSIDNPDIGLLVYDTNFGEIFHWNNGIWNRLNDNRISMIKDFDEDTYIDVESNQDEDQIRFIINSEDQFRIDYNPQFDNTRFQTNSNFGNLFLGYNAGLNYNRAQSNVLGQNVHIGSSAGKNSQANSYGNVFVGYNAGEANTTGNSNVFIGNRAGQKSNGETNNNTFIGYYSGFNNLSGSKNSYVGTFSGSSNTEGADNTFFGYSAGSQNNGSNNVMIGLGAGETNNGNNNIFIGVRAASNETGSNKLFIENSNSQTPLIYGEFDNDKIQINGSFHVTDFAKLEPRSDSPTSPEVGTIYYDIDDNKVKVWTGNSWENLN